MEAFATVVSLEDIIERSLQEPLLFDDDQTRAKAIQDIHAAKQQKQRPTAPQVVQLLSKNVHPHIIGAMIACKPTGEAAELADLAAAVDIRICSARQRPSDLKNKTWIEAGPYHSERATALVPQNYRLLKFRV